MMRTANRFLSPLLLVLLSATGAGPALSQGSADNVRRELLDRINAERQAAGVPPLRQEPALERVAQQHADEMSRRGSLEQGSSEGMQARLERAGYRAHEWTESVSVSSESLRDLLASWHRRNPSTWRNLLDADYRDVGIGVSRLQGTPLYTFLMAVPQSSWFQGETADLHDLARVRAEMLAQVNEARRRNGAGPLRAERHLDLSAQRHAEDMLSRNYFAHESPSGTTVRERSTAAGYDWRGIGENIAFGQLSVKEVMDTWMNSPGHRRNLLDPKFTDLGVGLAFGKGQDGSYQIYWVQNFGTPK
jgi:uncharacterized protein YkwD